MRVERDLPREVLEKLYKDFFPKPCLIVDFCEALGMKGKEQSVLAAGKYLEDKGLILESKIKDEGRAWRITALGIDKLEGKALVTNEGIEKMLREIVVLVGWSFLASSFFQIGYPSAYGKIYRVLVRFIRSYGTKNDQEVLRKIPELVDADIKRREDMKKKKGISIQMEADEATKRWTKEMLVDIARKLEQ